MTDEDAMPYRVVNKYTKKPIVVEAIQWTGDNFAAIEEWCGSRRFVDVDGATVSLYVDANKSWLPLEKWEWIIKDKLGFYPCKDEVFKTTYDFGPRTGENYYDEETLHKVHKALTHVGFTGAQVSKALGEMQNAGILFRERDPETGESDHIINTDSPIDNKYGRVLTEHGAFEPDEPLFIFRAKDKIAPAILAIYSILCDLMGSPYRHVDGIMNARAKFIDWQKSNGSKTPDSEASKEWLGH